MDEYENIRERLQRATLALDHNRIDPNSVDRLIRQDIPFLLAELDDTKDSLEWLLAQFDQLYSIIQCDYSWQQAAVGIIEICKAKDAELDRIVSDFDQYRNQARGETWAEKEESD